jgi:hypothetical protein
MPVLLSKGALAIAAVVAIVLNGGHPIRSKTLARCCAAAHQEEKRAQSACDELIDKGASTTGE